VYSYAAFGLEIVSELPLPELTAAACFTDTSRVVHVRFGAVQPLPAKLGADGMGFWATSHEACHFVEGVGAFLARAGSEIVVDRAPEVEDRVLRLSILGPALALVLHQRGLLVLHASVVARAGSAIAFLGSNGWGKSTIAAALHARGYDLVTDDVAVVALDDGPPHVLPGFSQLKLWPEAASLLGQAPEVLPQLHPGFDKRGWRASRGFSLEPRRLERFYVIAPGPSPAIEPVPTRQACLELLTHWYGHRFGGGLLESDSAALQLRQCASLASRTTMHRVCRSGGSRTLLEAAELVDQDFCRSVAAA
jgi:hypothetical protein